MKLHWGNAIFIYFTIFLSLAAIFIVFSFRQNIDLVEKDYYEQGANYSEQMDIINRSEIYSDSIYLKTFSNYIEIELCPSIKKSTTSVLVHFFRPSDKALDVKYELKTSESPFTFENENFSHGRYIAKFKWKTGKATYMVNKDLFIE